MQEHQEDEKHQRGAKISGVIAGRATFGSPFKVGVRHADYLSAKI
jgi:hypothetical protein